MNIVHLNLKAVSHKLKRKRKSHTHINECFTTKYLKLMTVPFKKIFISPVNIIFILNTSFTNKPNPPKRHWFTSFWLDKSYICKETLRIIQLVKDFSNSKKKKKIEKFENWKYVISTVTAALLFVTDCRRDPFRAGSVLINQTVLPDFCLCFSMTGIKFWGMLHHVYDVVYDKTSVDQSELVNVGAQINYSTICWSGKGVLEIHAKSFKNLGEGFCFFVIRISISCIKIVESRRPRAGFCYFNRQFLCYQCFR